MKTNMSQDSGEEERNRMLNLLGKSMVSAGKLR